MHKHVCLLHGGRKEQDKINDKIRIYLNKPVHCDLWMIGSGWWEASSPQPRTHRSFHRTGLCFTLLCGVALGDGPLFTNPDCVCHDGSGCTQCQQQCVWWSCLGTSPDMWCRWIPPVRPGGSGTSSSRLVQLAGGEEAVQRLQVVGGSEPPGHADAWLLSPRLSRRQSAPADECAGLVDELLSPRLSRRQSAPADECAGLVDELLSPRLSRRKSAPADECAGLVDELLSPRLSRRQSAPADECAGLVDELLSPQVTRLLVGSLG